MAYEIEKLERICAGAPIYELIFAAPTLAEAARPGQILHVVCGGAQSSLRRPLSICEAGDGRVRLCFEVRGAGTAELASRRTGDMIDVIGPYGNGFPTPDGRVYLVGGGIGIYPLLFAAKHIRAAGGEPVALLGLRTAALVNLVPDFERVCTQVRIATDDGSAGVPGFVTGLLDEALGTAPGQVFVCGPRPMMKNAAGVAAAHGAPCFVSMEERMGCGVGACLACVCRTLIVGNEARGEQYKRVCVDGPVFDAKEILWD